MNLKTDTENRITRKNHRGLDLKYSDRIKEKTSEMISLLSEVDSRIESASTELLSRIMSEVSANTEDIVENEDVMKELSDSLNEFTDRLSIQHMSE